MPTHIRLIHDEHREQALVANSPMRRVPELIRVFTPQPGTMAIYQVAKGYMTCEQAVKQIAATGVVWHQDILRGAGQTGFTKDAIDTARRGIRGLRDMLAANGLDMRMITLCTDWEAWSFDPVWDFGNWSAAVQDWPGPTANFGNAQSNVPGMFHWPNAKGSCWASHGTGTTPPDFRAGILKAKPYWGRTKGPTIACIADPAFFEYASDPSPATHVAIHREYITASKRADIVVHWPLWPGDDERAKAPGFRLQQDQLIAKAIGRGG